MIRILNVRNPSDRIDNGQQTVVFMQICYVSLQNQRTGTTKEAHSRNMDENVS